jgi:Cu+-exporting ATPase
VCLLGDDLARVGWAIALARKAVRIIRQNLIWAFAYNLVGIGLAAWGKLTPIAAALAMVLSSLIVVVNSRRLAGKKGGQPCPA